MQYDRECGRLQGAFGGLEQDPRLKQQFERKRRRVSRNSIGNTTSWPRRRRWAERWRLYDDGNSPPVPAPDKRKQFAFVGFVGGGGLPIGLLLLIGLLDSRSLQRRCRQRMSGMTLLGILPNLPDRLSDPAQASIAAHCVHQIRTMLQINAGEGQQCLRRHQRSARRWKDEPHAGAGPLLRRQRQPHAADRLRPLSARASPPRLDMARPERRARSDDQSRSARVLPRDRHRRSGDPRRSARRSGIMPACSRRQALRRLINEAKKHFEIILIDTGPILGSIEATPVVRGGGRRDPHRQPRPAAPAGGEGDPAPDEHRRPLRRRGLQPRPGARFRPVDQRYQPALDRPHRSTPSKVPATAHQRQRYNGARQKAGALGPVARAVATSAPSRTQDDAA